MKTILIIEDQPAIRRLVHATLENADFELHEAETGAEGLASARRLRPAVVVLDIMLPDMDGLDICRSIRADSALSDTKVLLLSASEEEYFMEAGRAAGADYCIRKPFSVLHLIEKIHELSR